MPFRRKCFCNVLSKIDLCCQYPERTYIQRQACVVHANKEEWPTLMCKNVIQSTHVSISVVTILDKVICLVWHAGMPHRHLLHWGMQAVASRRRANFEECKGDMFQLKGGTIPAWKSSGTVMPFKYGCFNASRAGFCCCYDRFLGWGVRIAWLQIWKYGWLTACFWESGTPGSLSMFRSLWHDGLFFLIIVFSETWFERRHCRLICFKCRNTVGNWQSKMAFTMATIQPWFVRCYLSAWFAPSSFPGS